VNSFRDQLWTLGRLQEVDIQIDKLKDEERQIPLLIEKIKENINTATARLDEKKAVLKTLQDQRRAKERELEEHEQRVKNDKSKLMNVKTNIEYQALLKEIEQIQKAGDERAEDILILLEQIDRAELEFKKAQGHYNDAKKKIEDDAALHQQRLVKIPEEISALDDKRKDQLKDIGPDLLRRYNGLRKLKAGVAIVKADGGVCQGCNMSVSPQMVNKLHRNEELVFCSNCQRILYWEGETRVNKIQPPATPTENQ
jgi:uncharacterized protein